MNLRPLDPEPAPGGVHGVAGVGRSWQAFDDIGGGTSGTVEGLPLNPTNGTDGSAFAEQVAADLRRTDYLRPEALLPVRAVAQRLGLSAATVHNDVNAGKLRWVLFGSVRRVRLEDFEAYAKRRGLSSRPSAGS